MLVSFVDARGGRGRRRLMGAAAVVGLLASVAVVVPTVDVAPASAAPLYPAYCGGDDDYYQEVNASGLLGPADGSMPDAIRMTRITGSGGRPQYTWAVVVPDVTVLSITDLFHAQTLRVDSPSAGTVDLGRFINRGLNFCLRRLARPGISLSMTSTSHPDANGDQIADSPIDRPGSIRYTLTATNTGTVELSNVVVQAFGSLSSITSCSQPLPAVLSPGASVACTAEQVVGMAQIAAGGAVVNYATVDSNYQGSILSKQTQYQTPIADRPAITVTKTSTSHPDADGNGVADSPLTSPATVEFQVTVTNTGNVALTDLAVSDPDLDFNGGLTCGSGVPVLIAPGASFTCTGSQTVFQGEIDFGDDLINTASASGRGGGHTVRDNASYDLPIRQIVSISAIKSSTSHPDKDKDGLADRPAQLDEPIYYVVGVTNTGNVAVDIAVTDPLATPSPLDCEDDFLGVGDSTDCTGSYTVTKDDIKKAAPIRNTATVTATGPNGLTDSKNPSYLVPVLGRSELVVRKVSTNYLPADPADHVAGTSLTGPGTIEFRIEVENTGTTTITGVDVDDFSGITGCEGSRPFTLGPTEVATCRSSVNVTPEQFEALPAWVNIASAGGKDPAGNDVTAADYFIVPFERRQALELTKSARGFADADGNGVADTPISEPKPVTYDLVATNTGNTPLAHVEITDATLGTLSCIPDAPATLAPRETLSCTGTRPVTQNDLDNGSPIVNAASVTSDGMMFDRVAYVIPVDARPKLTLTKTGASPYDDLDPVDGVSDAPITLPDSVDYVLTARNTGTETLSNVTVTDPMLNFMTCGGVGTTLLPGESLTCDSADGATYDVSQGVIDSSGDLFNVATATANAGDRLLKDQAVYDIPIDRRPKLTATKTAAPPFNDGDADGRSDASAVAGDVIEYVVTVTNTGNVTIGSISATDPIITDPIKTLTCIVDKLAPGQSTKCTGTYTVTQGDVDALVPLRNLATISGTSPTGQPVGTAAAYLVPVLDAPELLVRKSIPANPDGDGDFVGDTPLTGPATIDYEIEVANGGTVSLTGVEVTDTLLTTIDCPGGTSFVLAVGDAITCKGSLDVTQAMFDAEPGLVNIAVASGTAPGPVTVSGGWVAAVEFDHRPELTLVKSSTSHPDKDKNGVADTPITGPTTITYSLVATNTGNVTLTDVSVTDPLLPALGCGPATLAPGEQLTCSGDLTVDQGDIDAGGDVLNTATATGSFGGATVSDRSVYDVAISASAALALEKTSTSHPDADGDGVADQPAEAPGAVTYRLTATNTGTTTLTGVEIADPDLPTLSCTPTAPATLAPGASVVCTGSSQVDQADIDTGGDIVNVATAAARTATRGDLTTDAAYTIPVGQRPGISLTKTPAEQTFVVGTRVAVFWTVTATNTGNVTLTNLAFSDGLVDDATGVPDPLPGCTLPLGDLAPGRSASVVCSTIRTITAAEFANLATVAAQSPAGAVSLGAVATVHSTVDGLPPTGANPSGTISTAILVIAAGAALVAAASVRRRSMGSA